MRLFFISFSDRTLLHESRKYYVKVSKLLFSCVLLGSTIGTVQAETQYVTENLNTYLRKGAGDQFKIAGAIQSGEAVTVLEQQGKYTLIRDIKIVKLGF